MTFALVVKQVAPPSGQLSLEDESESVTENLKGFVIFKFGLWFTMKTKALNAK